MQPTDPSLSRRQAPHRPPPLHSADDGASEPAPTLGPGPPVGGPRLRLAARALLVEARFRDVTLASRFLQADAVGAFTIGAARGVDAPVNPAWISEPPAPSEAVRHVLVEPLEPLVDGFGGGFALNLTSAMRAELCTPVQRLALAPDFGRAEAPLVLPPESFLSVACGEMVFEIRTSDPVAALPRPWLSAGWRVNAKYTLAVTLALLAILGLAYLMAPDRRALSLDDIDVSRRFAGWLTLPPEAKMPEIDHTLAWLSKPGGGGAPAAAGPTGAAGSPKAPHVDARRATKGPASPLDARAAAAQVRANSLLAVLDGPKGGSLAAFLSDEPALGAAASDVLGHLEGVTIADEYGVGSMGVLGTGSGGGGTHEGLVGGGGLGTIGRFGTGPGDGPGYGVGVGRLATRKPTVPSFIPGASTVRGSLDKEIIRRIVRRHINEVRYCYEQALVTHPSLGGRLVVQFTIAPTGRVLASLLQSSTVGSPAVDGCVVQAIKRWEFPQPEGGGLVMVSYPFQLTPGG
jgi:TonB family protein